MCEWFTGVRAPDGDPLVLAADKAGRGLALARLASDCITLDGAGSVVIGGGPLSAAALALRERFETEIIEPLPAAIRCAARLLGMGR